MVIFHSYVKLPEGILVNRITRSFFHWIFLRSHPGFSLDDLRLRSPENKDKETLGGTDH